MGIMSKARKTAKHLGVDLVAFARALGDHPQLLGMRQHQAVGQVFDQQEEPFVRGGRLNDDLKGPQISEKRSNRLRLVALEPRSLYHLWAASN